MPRRCITWCASASASPTRRRTGRIAARCSRRSMARSTRCVPVPVDFGALIVERASAARLMMTVAQIVKHIDGSAPVRFLIAETESGYTLLAALWLARLFGVERHIEISPLFETAEALEHGATVLEEALRSPHYRTYLRQTGRLALQFGYSDSGRYVGQIAASYLIERLRLKIADTLARFGVTGVEVVLFDTHGESIGRGGASRLAQRPAEISLAHREPPGAQQGGPHGARGECVPGRRRLSAVRHAATGAGDGRAHRRAQLFIPPPGRSRIRSMPTRISSRISSPRSDRAWRRWSMTRDTARCSARSARRCSTAPARGRRRGSRRGWRRRRASAIRASCGRSPTTRSCSSSAGAPTRCRGWVPRRRATRRFSTRCATNSRRFRRALDLATHGLAHSDLDVLRAVAATLDPGSWLDRAAQHAPAGAAGGAGRGGASPGAAGHLGGGAVDVPPHPVRSPGTPRDLAGRAAHAGARGAAARGAARADPEDLAASD